MTFLGTWARGAWRGLTSRERIHCREFGELLDDYVDGELPAQKALHLDAHRCVCVRCSARWRKEKNFIDVLRAKVQQSPSPDFVEALRKRLREQK
jgi:anti-sigma factor RsiW